MPVVAEVMKSHPHLAVDLRLSNRVVDLVEEGIDVGVRVASSLDGQYVARPLAVTRLVFVGAPEYFRKHGRPRTPEDLTSHRTILFTEPRVPLEFVFSRDVHEVRVSLKSMMTSNTGATQIAAVRRGVGLAAAPSFIVGDDMRAGSIEPVLLDWPLRQYRVFVIYPHRRFLSPKVRVFIDALRAAYGDGTRDPWWPETLPVGVPTRAASSRRRKRAG